MLNVGKKYKKICVYLILTLLTLGVGFSSFAQFTNDAYVVRTVHIFPSQIESVGWNNAEI